MADKVLNREKDKDVALDRAMKHALKTRDYEMLEILLVRFVEEEKTTFPILLSTTWIRPRSVYRFLILWNDELAIELFHKHKAGYIKLALMHFGTKEQILRWLTFRFEEHQPMMIIRYILNFCKLNLLRYVLTTPIRDLIVKESEWCIWLALMNSFEHMNPRILHLVLDIFENHGVSLHMSSSNRKKIDKMIAGSPHQGVITYMFELEIARILHK